MESEGSFPQSQVSATCPYPEPTRSSPYSHIPHPEVVLYCGIILIPSVGPLVNRIVQADDIQMITRFVISSHEADAVCTFITVRHIS